MHCICKAERATFGISGAWPLWPPKSSYEEYNQQQVDRLLTFRATQRKITENNRCNRAKTVGSLYNISDIITVNVRQSATRYKVTIW